MSGRGRWSVLGGVVAILFLTSVSTALTFTVATESDWTQGTLDEVTVRNDTLELETPLQVEGFETELALDHWDIWYGDAFVPESGFTGNDAIALHRSENVSGLGNVTHLNYSIPDGFEFESGAQFSAWAKHNGSETSDYRVTYRLTGSTGVIEAWADEADEELVCRTEQGSQVVHSDAAVDSWYQFVFTLYPENGVMNCEIRDDAGDTIGDVNLSTTIDFTQVVIQGTGDRPPWAWFDDVTIPKYRTDGQYTQYIDNNDLQNWTQLDADVANISADTDVDAVFKAQDSTGSTIRRQIIDLVNGQQPYDLTVPPSQDGTIILNGTTDDPSQTWSVKSYTVHATTTDVSAPSIDQPAVSSSTVTAGESVTFTAELTDDDYEQNTVALWTQENGSTGWTRRETTSITPTSPDTVVSIAYTFSAGDVGDHEFKFNTTDASGFTDETQERAFTVEAATSSGVGDGNSSEGGAGGNQTDSNSTTDASPGTGQDGQTGTVGNTSNGAGDQTGRSGPDRGPDATDSDRGGDRSPSGQEPWRFLLAGLILTVLAIIGYYTHR